MSDNKSENFLDELIELVEADSKNEIQIKDQELISDGKLYKGSWEKMPTESNNGYMLFCQFLHSEYTEPNDWIESLSEAEKIDLPFGFKSEVNLKNYSKRLCWQLRKNDWENQVWSIARKKEETIIQDSAVSLSQIFNDQIKWIKTSQQKRIEAGEILTVDEMMKFMRMAIDYQMNLEQLENTKKIVSNWKSQPTEKLEELWTTLKKLDESEDK